MVQTQVVPLRSQLAVLLQEVQTLAEEQAIHPFMRLEQVTQLPACST